MNVIEVKGLTKKFKSLTAVNDVSFQVEKGTIFGLLGPNGAGKTTTIESMIGLKKPEKGSVRLLDLDALTAGKKLYDFIGVQLQETSYQDKIKVNELCSLFENMYDKPLPYKALLSKFGIADKEKSYINQLSGGQKQKVAIILALISNPEIIFLDELTTGLDPKARREMWEHVKQLKEEGRTVFLTTHYMEEASYLCDQIAIIDGGELIIKDTVEGVINSAELLHEVSFYADVDIVERLRKDLSVEAFVEKSRIKVLSKKEDIISDVILYLREANINYRNIDILRPTLEDAYLKLTGKEWEE